MANGWLRPVLAAALLLLTAADGRTQGADAEWRFKALLDDKEIGYHNFRVRADGAQAVVESEARFRVTILLFDAYRYDHRDTETWREGCLVRIDARTDDNGDAFFVNGAQRGDALLLATQAGPASFPGCVRTFAYWDLAALRAAERLLNSQTGEYLPVTFERNGSETIAVGGIDTPAERYRLRAEGFDIDLWYTPDGRWLQLDSLTSNGKRLRYRLDE